MRYCITLYSGMGAPGGLGFLASELKPLVPSGPRGCLTTVSLGPPSSKDIVRRRLINLSGLC